MVSSVIIPLLIAIPFFVGGLICLLSGRNQKLFANLGIATSLVVLTLSVVLVQQVSMAPSASTGSPIQPRINYAPEWMQLDLPFSIQSHSVHWQLELGADGLSAWLVLLNGIVTAAVLLTSKHQIRVSNDLYAGLVLITQSMLMGVFLAMDLLLFYIFFEAVLLPIILLINLWGDSKTAISASRKFLLFTLAGSIPMIVGIVGLVLHSATPIRASTVQLTALSQIAYDTQLAPIIAESKQDLEATQPVPPFYSTQYFILAALLLGFGIKMALLPLHGWLPTTYSAAHPNTTALIAAVVGKLGVYGLLRIVLPLTPIALAYHAQMVIATLGAIAVVYGAVVALAQTDLRRLMAYSSLSHMGFVTVGLMAMNREGLAGASLQMFNHGLIASAMFILVAMIEERRGRIVLWEEKYGLAAVYPRLAFLFVFFTLAGAGLPGLNSFVGEILAMMGMIRVSGPIVGIAILGTVLGAWYALRVVQDVFFSSDGKTKDRQALAIDARPNEWCALLPIGVLCIAIGVRPSFFTDVSKPEVERLAVSLEPVVKRVHPATDTLAIVEQR